MFSLLGALMLLLSGKGEISLDGFKVVIPIGTYYISWDEVECIEIGAGNLVLSSGTKRLCFPSIEYWSGKDKIQAIEILASIIEKREIEIKETKRAIIPSYKNTRVREIR